MRILITGAGGASAISVWKSLAAEHEIHMGDKDACAAGLYLVPESQRVILAAADHPDFVKLTLEVCKQRHIDVLISTVDAELYRLAAQTDVFLAAGIQLPLSPYSVLMRCRDKFELLSHCDSILDNQRFSLLTATREITASELPLFVKPRSGSGSAGAFIAHHLNELQHLPKDGSYLIQEYLPGEEYSIDVYIHSDGTPIAAVPRLRLKIDSGIAVASMTKHDAILSDLAIRIAMHVGIRYVANVQVKRTLGGDYKLLEINPRFPGTLPLTVAAGVDMPKLLLADLQGEKFSGMMPFKSLMTVRYLTECFIDPREWEALCPKPPLG